MEPRWVVATLATTAVIGGVALSVLLSPPPSSRRGVRIMGSLATTQGLQRPQPKACLSGPGAADVAADDRAMVASAGLDAQQVTGAMRSFVHHVLPCLRGETPTETLDLRITVACTGVVSEVTWSDRGDWSTEVAMCVADTLSYASFPAHDLPDGETFEYPLRFTK